MSDGNLLSAAQTKLWNATKGVLLSITPDVAKTVTGAGLVAFSDDLLKVLLSVARTTGTLGTIWYVLNRGRYFEESSVARAFVDNLKYVQFVERPSLDFLSTAYYYALMANGIYDDAIIEGWSRDWEAGTQRWLQPLTKAPESIRERPRFGYYIDWYRRTMVIMVRGTSSVADDLTDVEARTINLQAFGDLKLRTEIELCQPTVESFNAAQLQRMWATGEHQVHYGFMNAARHIVNDPCAPFSVAYGFALEAFGMPQDDMTLPIYVTGHSLGASTSACIVYMLRKNNYQAFGVLYAPAPTFTPAVLMDEPDKCRDCIVSFVNRYDVVTHLEPAIVSRSVNYMLGKLLGDESSSDPTAKSAAAAFAKQNADDATAYEQKVKNFHLIFPGMTDVERAKLVASIEGGSSELKVLEDQDQALIAAIPERRYFKAATIKLALPGTSYWIHYYNGPNGNSPSASLWRILSHNFIDFMPFVYAYNTPGKTDMMEANNATDHSMTNYLKHLRFIYHVVSTNKFRTTPTAAVPLSNGSETVEDRRRRITAESAAQIAAADSEMAAFYKLRDELAKKRNAASQ